MAVEEPRARVTLTIPAKNIDDFRVGVLADLKSEVEGFSAAHADMLEARDEGSRSICREDRDSRLRGSRGVYELLEQLPGDDVETTVSGTTVSFRFALEDAGRLLVEQVRREFEYCPVPVESVLSLLDRLRWTVEQAAAVGEGA